MASAMTTTLSPADRQAFIQALRDDPVFREEARALLLSREVLELPGKLAQLTDRVDRFIAAQESFNAEQRQFHAEQRQFNETAETRFANIDRFIENQESFNAEQRQFNQTVDARFAKIDRFIENQESFNAEQRQFNQDVTVRLGQALGGNLEAKLERSIGPVLARTFGLYDVRTLQSRFTMPNQEFNRRLAQAQAEGKITADQAFQLDRADYIVYGRQAADDAEVYFVAEVSWTLGQNDIIRARERADLMAAASGVNTIAVAIAQEIPPPQVEQAATAQVILIHDDGN